MRRVNKDRFLAEDLSLRRQVVCREARRQAISMFAAISLPEAISTPPPSQRSRSGNLRGRLLPLTLALGLLSPLVATAAQTCKPAIPASTPTGQFLDHGDGTLTDTRTGLMWKQCLEGSSGAGCASGSVSPFTWQGALERPGVVNGGGGFAGHTDWRLPNINELRSIVEEQCWDPAINLTLFPNTPGWYYWSSSPNAGLADSAWVVNFYDGYPFANQRDPFYYGYDYAVRLVRGGE